MDEFTTGAFARATGLTRKALRLYDDLDLLRPDRTDPVTGYRYYAAAQLPVARRVAWLRRVGMPLVRIRACSDLSPAEIAAVVRDWWAQEEAAGVERRGLVAALVEALEEDDMPETDKRSTLRLRCGAATAQGPVRDRQQDGAAGGEWFAVVADGFGPDGTAVSARAIEAVAGAQGRGPGEVLAALDAVHGALRDTTEEVRRPMLAGDVDPSVSGSTVTALVLTTDQRLALVHVGDSRAWLLRDGVLTRLTHDHTLVRSMVEAGTLTEEEAASHPQRATLLRALAPGQDGPDLALHSVREGDRYLLATDGLHGQVAPEAVAAVLIGSPGPVEASRALIDLALAAGAPDNVAVAVADIVC
ncbi:MAG: MerR family transcriptional regulator [Actinomycetota bacterium]